MHEETGKSQPGTDKKVGVQTDAAYAPRSGAERCSANFFVEEQVTRIGGTSEKAPQSDATTSRGRVSTLFALPRRPRETSLQNPSTPTSRGRNGPGARLHLGLFCRS
jgi:hypothetical protein